MQIGMIGLGRMGGNIVRRLLRSGHRCVVFDRQSEPVTALAAEGAVAAADLKELVAQSEEAARGVGDAAGRRDHRPSTVAELGALHGARRHHHRRRQLLLQGRHPARGRACARRSIHYVDVGTSGGVWGLERGYCMMIGGDKETVDRLDPIFEALAPGLGGIAADARPPGARHRAPSAATSIAARTAPAISSR